MRWVFVRHGESEANQAGWLSGHRDVALTPAGEAQARALGEALAGRVFTRVCASDLQRAWRTAALALPAASIERHAALRERHLGDWEGRQRAALVADGGMASLVSWVGAPPGGESQRDLAARVLVWLAEQPPAASTLVVAHGGVLRVIAGLAGEVPLDAIGTRAFANTERWECDAGPSDWAALARRAAGSGTGIARGATWG